MKFRSRKKIWIACIIRDKRNIKKFFPRKSYSRVNAIAGKKLRCYQSEKTSDRKLSKNCLLYYCTLNLLIFIWLFVGVFAVLLLLAVFLFLLLLFLPSHFLVSRSLILRCFVSLLLRLYFLYIYIVFYSIFTFAIWPSKWVQTTRHKHVMFFPNIRMNALQWMWGTQMYAFHVCLAYATLLEPGCRFNCICERASEREIFILYVCFASNVYVSN